MSLASLLLGFGCGVLSGVGVGGGSLLMLWLTGSGGLAQAAAQGVNLAFFLPTAGSALVLHGKNRLIEWRVAVPAVIGGCVCGSLCAFLAAGLSSALLQQLFGGFLLIAGASELFGVLMKGKQSKKRSVNFSKE